MSTVRILLIAILVSIATYWFFDNLKKEGEREKNQAIAKALVEQARSNPDFVDLLAPRPLGAFDKGMIGLPSEYRPATSAWESAEKARYRSLFPAKSFDVLVVPFQVEEFALDRSTARFASV